jgi:hypothetical protein
MDFILHAFYEIYLMFQFFIGTLPGPVKPVNMIYFWFEEFISRLSLLTQWVFPEPVGPDTRIVAGVMMSIMTSFYVENFKFQI